MSSSNNLELDNALKSSIMKYMLVSFLTIFILLGGMVVWAVKTDISGAVIASGTIVVEGNSKQVQHQEGGIVKRILVKDGDMVKAGDLLIQLDDTTTKAGLANITEQLDSLYAQDARLIAEQNGAKELSFADDNRSPRVGSSKHALEKINTNQINLFNARRNSILGQKQQLAEQIVQFEKQIQGLQSQSDAKKSERGYLEKELVNLEALLKKKLVPASRVSALQRDKSKLTGELGELSAQIAQTREAISERNIQILQVDQEFLTSVLQQRLETRTKIAQLEEQKINVLDQLSRVEIRAPRSGVIHDLNVHTIGQVIQAAEVTMLIVPDDDQLIVEAQVLPVNIDQIAINQTAKIRLPSFDQRVTPELGAIVKTISADLFTDTNTGLSFYTTSLVMPETELSKLGNQQLVPGMPVETFIKTNDRSVISYLVKPITDQIRHAMRER